MITKKQWKIRLIGVRDGGYITPVLEELTGGGGR